MIERIFLGLILVFFIFAFAIRNITTYLSTGKSIRGRSVKLTASIVLSTLIYLFIFYRLLFADTVLLFEIDLSSFKFVYISGMIIVSAGFILGLFALAAMKDSWRVGIKYDQKTDLVTEGIYRISRNPYFLSYDILIFGYILIFPSPVLALLYLILVTDFHLMILEEEKYLESVHKTEYTDYKHRTGRYLGLR